MEGSYTKTTLILRPYIKVQTKEGRGSKPNFLEGQETNLLPNIRWYRPKRPITEIVTSNWFPDRYLLISPVVHLFLYSKNISKLTTLLHHGAPTRDASLQSNRQSCQAITQTCQGASAGRRPPQYHRDAERRGSRYMGWAVTTELLPHLLAVNINDSIIYLQNTKMYFVLSFFPTDHVNFLFIANGYDNLGTCLSEVHVWTSKI